MRKYIALFLMIIVTINLSPPSVLGKEKVDFSVRALLPENQQNDRVTYFDLIVEPNTTQPLKVEIFNHSDEVIVIVPSVKNSRTNQNGIIVYDDTENEEHLSLKDILTFSFDEIEVASRSSKIVEAQLEIPDTEISGIILGGLHFEKKDKGDNGKGEGVYIENKFAYLIGVQLSKYNDIKIEPELKYIQTTSSLVDYRTSLVVEIKNETPTIIDDVSLHTKIYRNNHSEIWKEKKLTDVKLAPNSKMDVVVDLNNEPIESGKYSISLEASTPTKKWEFTDEINVEKERANQINSEAVELKDLPINNRTFYLTSFVFISIIIILIAYIWILKRKPSYEK